PTTSSRPTAGLCTRSKAERDKPKAVLLGSGCTPPGGVCSGPRRSCTERAETAGGHPDPGHVLRVLRAAPRPGRQAAGSGGRKLSVSDLSAVGWLVKGVSGGPKG